MDYSGSRPASPDRCRLERAIAPARPRPLRSTTEQGEGRAAAGQWPPRLDRRRSREARPGAPAPSSATCRPAARIGTRSSSPSPSSRRCSAPPPAAPSTCSGASSASSLMPSAPPNAPTTSPTPARPFGGHGFPRSHGPRRCSRCRAAHGRRHLGSAAADSHRPAMGSDRCARARRRGRRSQARPLPPGLPRPRRLPALRRQVRQIFLIRPGPQNPSPPVRCFTASGRLARQNSGCRSLARYYIWR
jgi:hypothetical protein